MILIPNLQTLDICSCLSWVNKNVGDCECVTILLCFALYCMLRLDLTQHFLRVTLTGLSGIVVGYIMCGDTIRQPSARRENWPFFEPRLMSVCQICHLEQRRHRRSDFYWIVIHIFMTLDIRAHYPLSGASCLYLMCLLRCSFLAALYSQWVHGNFWPSWNDFMCL